MSTTNPEKILQQGKVTTTTRLNIRSQPNTKADIVSIINKDIQLAYDGYTNEGENISGNTKWYYTNEGNWFWSGGVDENKQTSVIKQENYPQWMLDLRIPQLWTKATGKGVGVAIVDTGIDIGNPDLPYSKDKSYVYDKQISLQDVDGHGTHCAGLIGARNKGSYFIGVAPECNLFICKISESGSLDDSQTKRYADVIDWCSKQDEINIISISWGSFIDDRDVISSIELSINSAVARNKIVVCAIGNASKFPDNSKVYPACLENTIVIGAIPVQNKLYPYINSFLLTSTNGFEIKSYALNNLGIIPRSGTSQANAIIAGLIALKIESMAFSFNYNSIKKFLTDVSITNNFNGIAFLNVSGDLLLKNFTESK